MWLKNTIGTTTAGSQLNGKYMIARFGWPKAIDCSGEGKARTAVATMFVSKRSATTFHAINNGRLVVPFLNARK